MMERVLGLIRHILTGVGGYLVSGGLIDEMSSLEFVGGAMAVIGVVWSWLAKTPASDPSDPSA